VHTLCNKIDLNYFVDIWLAIITPNIEHDTSNVFIFTLSLMIGILIRIVLSSISYLPNSKVFLIPLKLTKANAAARRSKAVAEVSEPFKAKATKLQKRMDALIQKSRDDQYVSYRSCLTESF
jgi:hypothetical protein